MIMIQQGAYNRILLELQIILKKQTDLGMRLELVIALLDNFMNYSDFWCKVDILVFTVTLTNVKC